MSPRYERLMFRLGLLVLVLVLGVFVYRTEVDPPNAAGVVNRTTTTSGPVTPSTASTIPARAPFNVSSPRDESRVAQPVVLLAGVGNPGAVVARGEDATNVDARGVWALRLSLTEGPNELEMVETAPDGSQQTTAITVYYEP